MAYRDKIIAKEKLEKDMLQLLQEFYKETGYRVTDISIQDYKGIVSTFISKVSVTIDPQV